MINKYLFITDDLNKEIANYNSEGVVMEVTPIENTTLRVVSFSYPGKNEKSAKKLSDVHTFVSKHASFTLLCESSEYFNKALYPLVNAFERKLRMVLFIVSSISDSSAANKTIRDLESKTLGVIFESLFVDNDFCNKARERINGKGEYNGRGSYTKAEIQAFFLNVEEKPMWDSLFSDASIPTLKIRYIDMLNIRNGVMHAHNIDKEEFRKAKYLLNKINIEIDNEIARRIGQVEKYPDEVDKNANDIISTALGNVEHLESAEPLSDEEAVAKLMKAILPDSEILKHTLGINNIIAPLALKHFNETQELIKKAFVPNPDILKIVEKTMKLDPAILNAFEESKKIWDSPVMKQLRTQQEQYEKLFKPVKDAQKRLHRLTNGASKNDNIDLSDANNNDGAEIE